MTMPMGGGSPTGAGMPPGATGSPQTGGNTVDMQQVLLFFQQTVKSLVASGGLSEEQAITQAMQMVSQKYGPEAAQQLMMAAEQAGGQGETQAPTAGGPGQYGPAAPGTSGMA